MKRLCTLSLLLLAAAPLAAQNPVIYFMEGATSRGRLNPALAPQQGYFNFPGIGTIDINTSGNIALNRILYPDNGQLVPIIDSAVPADIALAGLSAENILRTDVTTNILGFGAYTRNRKDFWSFDINLRASTESNIPYSLIEFFKTGRENTIRRVGVDAESLLEAAFTYSFPVANDRLYIGLRGKFLAGAARANLTYDRLDVTLDEERWLIAAEGGLDIFAPGISAQYTTEENGEQTYTFENLDLKPSGPAGYGFALDLGLSYDILPQLQVSLAVNDLGFIEWSRRDNLSGTSVKSLEFTGVTVEGDGETTQQPDFDFDILRFSKQAPHHSTRMLRTSANAGIEYRMWQNRISIGALYSMHVRRYGTQHTLTGSVNFRPLYWLHLTGSYSLFGSRGDAFGVALNLSPSWINLFIATDVVTARISPQWIPVDRSSINVTFGLGFPIGKRGWRNLPGLVLPRNR